MEFLLKFCAGCQNSLPGLLFGCELPPALIDLSLEDAPKVLHRAEIRGGWGPHHEFLFFYAVSANDAEVFLAEQDCLKISLHVFQGPLEWFLLVSIG